MIVEIAFKLDNELKFYDKLLNDNGLKQCFSCTTHDIYYTNIKTMDNLSEVEIKNSCVRLRMVNNDKCKVENKQHFKELEHVEFSHDVMENEEKLKIHGFYKVFDTTKRDFHYYKEGMNSRVQLQDIDDIGLVLYYDNSLYYGDEPKNQRNKLIDELNSYGFNFKHDRLNIDKLRSLYFNREIYSDNKIENIKEEQK